MIISETQKPPVGGWGGSINDWERGTDPFHEDAFPEEFKRIGFKGTPRTGWLALDFWKNVIGFCPDGVDWK